MLTTCPVHSVAAHKLFTVQGALRRMRNAQVLSKPDVERFVDAAHLLTAPGGVFFGSTAGSEQAGADVPGLLACLNAVAQIAGS